MTFENQPSPITHSTTQPESCSKFDHCSATVCALDPDRAMRKVHRDDPVCFYLLEISKPGGVERISMGHSEEFIKVVTTVYLEVASTACPIKKSLERAKQTPSRMRPVTQGTSLGVN